MKIKTIIVTVLALAALSAVVFFINRPTPPPSGDARVHQPLLPAALAEAAAKVKITDQGKTVLLTKQADNTWRVTSYHDLPADFSKLSTLIGELTSAKVEQFVTANPDRLARLEFKDTQVALLDAADKTLWSVTLGKNADAGGRFIRFGDEAKGFRATLNAWLDPEAKGWADSSLVGIKQEDVARVEIDLPGAEPVVATRAKKEDAFAAQNTPAGQKLKADKITSVLASLCSLRFTDTSDLTDANVTAAKQNQRNVKLTTFDGKTWTIALGRKPEQKIIKPPVPKADGKTGPAALGTLAEVAKPAEPAGADPTKTGGPSTVTAPETETIPAGPVYAFVSNSDAQAPINGLMAKRAFQVTDYEFTLLPQKADEVFEAAPPPPPMPPAASTPPAANAPAPSAPATPPSAAKGEPK